MVIEPDESLLGETLHVNLENLGTAYKADFVGGVEGKWDYTFHLPDVSLSEVIMIEKDVEGNVFKLDSIELSPVSMKANYTVTGEVNMYEDNNGIPDFCGVLLKDGTRLSYLSDGGMSGYTDDTLSKAYDISAFDRVIDPDQVTAILLRTGEGTELIEIEISG